MLHYRFRITGTDLRGVHTYTRALPYKFLKHIQIKIHTQIGTHAQTHTCKQKAWTEAGFSVITVGWCFSHHSSLTKTTTLDTDSVHALHSLNFSLPIYIYKYFIFKHYLRSLSYQLSFTLSCKLSPHHVSVLFLFFNISLSQITQWHREWCKTWLQWKEKCIYQRS